MREIETIYILVFEYKDAIRVGGILCYTTAYRSDACLSYFYIRHCACAYVSVRTSNVYGVYYELVSLCRNTV